MDKIDLIKQQITHIKIPYTFEQILESYLEGDYNSELLLQHCILYLVNNKQQQQQEEEIRGIDKNVLGLIEHLKKM